MNNLVEETETTDKSPLTIITQNVLKTAKLPNSSSIKGSLNSPQISRSDSLPGAAQDSLLQDNLRAIKTLLSSVSNLPDIKSKKQLYLY